MKPVRQEDELGCAVACVAFVLGISYTDSLSLFSGGKRRVKEQANFFCPEIVQILQSNGLRYYWQKLPKTFPEEDFPDLCIVFIKKSATYPYGHFLCRYKEQWMDPWINFPQIERKAGFRNALPNEPVYIINPH